MSEQSRRTRIVESVRDRKGQLLLGALAVGGLGLAAKTRSGTSSDHDALVAATVESLARVTCDGVSLLSDLVDHPVVDGTARNAVPGFDDGPDVVLTRDARVDLVVEVETVDTLDSEVIDRLHDAATEEYTTALVVSNGARDDARAFLDSEPRAITEDVRVETPTSVTDLV